ncbi:MAG: ribonuclease HII [Terriglobales bacterium]
MLNGWQFERQAWQAGHGCVAGVDEVGRGALFGPVVAAAVVLNPAVRLRGLNDSKQLTPERREHFAAAIQERALGWAVASVDAGCIDAINILQASRRAMLEALRALRPQPEMVLVDAVKLDWPGAQRAIVHGDALSDSIAAASIVAKVYRDALLRQWDVVFPVYRLASNKGYGSQEHRAALERYGPSPLHRRSFNWRLGA